MNLLSAQEISKSHGIKELFRGISFGIEDDDRVGLIGANGSGKSTLLQVLSGGEKPDTGQVVLRQGVRVQYAAQNPAFDPDHTVLQYVFFAHTNLADTVGEYERVLLELEASPEDAGKLQQLDELSQRMDALQAWEYESRARVVLGKLGVRDLTVKVGKLSGGYRKRLALARALLAEADLLILDEPTNHLDADTIAWLENYLKRMPGALLVVTHDRYFLDRVTRRIIELESGRLLSYDGNFSYYLGRKLEQAASEVRANERARSILRKEMDWLSRGARARRTKEKHRIDRIGEMQAAVPGRKADALKFESGTRRLGSKIVEMENVSKSFGHKRVIDDFTYTFPPGERVGLIGPNGAGKSTLVNLITGGVRQDDGKIEVGSTVHFGLFDQESSELEGGERALDFVKRTGGEYLRAADRAILSAERMMERFGFTTQMLYQDIAKLSGGEKRRLHLVQVLMKDPNFLILDEPTNDLDIATLQALEDFLDDFAGCLLVVSHDRYFLNRTIEHVLAIEPGGRIRDYPGDYSVYQQMHEQREATVSPTSKMPSAAPAVASVVVGATTSRKLSFKEQRELADLEKNIPAWEERQQQLEIEIAAAATDYMRLQELTHEQMDLGKRLEAAIVRWEELATRAGT
ncbi:MAG: ABC-F family ATP-binding cassette domain-containing protein [Candidatus Sumerlaeaceae bacterium]